MKQSMIIDLLSTQFVADPHLTLKAVQGTNTPLQDKHTNAYLILHHSHVTQVLRSSDFTTAPLASRAQPVMGERVLAQMEGCEHHGKRKAILSQLTGRLFREQYAHSIRHIIRGPDQGIRKPLQH
jgi:pulcherriminic acid synthase